ncbi:putative membrane protein YesL [Bacillus mycoides]
MIYAFKKVFSENYIALIFSLLSAFLFVNYNNLKFMDYFYLASVILLFVSFLYCVAMNYVKLGYEKRKKERMFLEER